MKITEISVFQVDLPLHEGSYKWSGGKSVEVFDSTVVRIETDAGPCGHGEVCPLGPVYLPSYARGVRAGLEELAPQLVGEDPTQLERLNRTMDRALKGHPYVKSAVDMAAWDILGQAAGMPVCELLGGRYGDDFVLYRAISQDAPDAMAASVAAYRDEGYRRFQLKVGGDADVDIERDRLRAAAQVLETGELRGMPVGAPSHRSPLRAGRVQRRHRRAGCAGTRTSPWTWSTSRSGSSAACRGRGRPAICATRSASP